MIIKPMPDEEINEVYDNVISDNQYLPLGLIRSLACRAVEQASRLKAVRQILTEMNKIGELGEFLTLRNSIREELAEALEKEAKDG